MNDNTRAGIWFPKYNSSMYACYREQLPPLAQQEGFMFVDGDDAISGQTCPVFDDHVHFGDRGNQIIGDHLAKILYTVIKKMETGAPKN